MLPSEHFATVQNQNESVCESKEGQNSSFVPQEDRQIPVTGTQQPLKSEDELESTAKVPSVPEQDNSEENQLTTLASVSEQGNSYNYDNRLLLLVEGQDW